MPLCIYRIDYPSSVFRRRLDREAQSSYHFQVLVSDGPTGTSSAPEDSTGRSTRGERWNRRVAAGKQKVHTASTTVVITVTDVNDNSPTFIQPNATNHLILLDPATIPGRSLLEVSIIVSKCFLYPHGVFAQTGPASFLIQTTLVMEK